MAYNRTYKVILQRDAPLNHVERPSLSSMSEWWLGANCRDEARTLRTPCLQSIFSLGTKRWPLECDRSTRSCDGGAFSSPASLAGRPFCKAVYVMVERRSFALLNGEPSDVAESDTHIIRSFKVTDETCRIVNYPLELCFLFLCDPQV